MRFRAEYSDGWAVISLAVREHCGWRCERCHHKHDPAAGYTLTVHHLDGDKSNDARWNLAGLCQRCHLHIQAKVEMPQFYMFAHSVWMRLHVAGYYLSQGFNLWLLEKAGVLGDCIDYLEWEAAYDAILVRMRDTSPTNKSGGEKQ